MRRRKISEQAVEAVIANPSERRPARPLADNRPAEILFGDVVGRRLKVYIEMGRTPPFVKTAAWAGRRRR
jgi:hypothetical protein